MHFFGKRKGWGERERLHLKGEEGEEGGEEGIGALNDERRRKKEREDWGGNRRKKKARFFATPMPGYKAAGGTTLAS